MAWQVKKVIIKNLLFILEKITRTLISGTKYPRKAHQILEYNSIKENPEIFLKLGFLYSWYLSKNLGSFKKIYWFDDQFLMNK